MHSVKLILTDAQMNKMKSSSPFQLSHRQLSGQSKGKHEVTLHLPEADSRRLVNNVQQGKGFRFNPKKFLRQAKNTLKKVGSATRKAGKFVVDNVPKEIPPKWLYLVRPSIGQYFSNRKELQAGADEIFEKVKFGKIKIRISKKYKLADASNAHADLEARKLIGPAILIP